MKINEESRALTEVWEWKEDAYREVEGLDLETALNKRLNASLETTRTMGFELTPLQVKPGKKSS